ncbi:MULTISPECIES: hypothetical protein [Vibrio]|uniref:ADP-ribosyltransferase-containing protein n=2 Tax=Vibrionaceae TaxID=641 RepID=UPI0008412997|nr:MULTISPECIES: hypothetical protein [Vibrio]ODM56927.1 hypothetical protein BC455_17690 [Vibrio harveyi]USD58444.1 hypothetical protein J4N44_27510 [Vibrio sp. SCSIO 43155]
MSNSNLLKPVKENTWFHGTPHDFEEFDIECFGTNEGRGDYIGKAMFFGFDEERSIPYARESGFLLTVELKMENPLIIYPSHTDFNPWLNIKPESLSDFEICKTIVENKSSKYSIEARAKYMYATLFMTPEEVAEYFKGQGYDGLIDYHYGQAGVFSARQITIVSKKDLTSVH